MNWNELDTLQVPPFSLYFVTRDVQNFWSNELYQDGPVEIENLFSHVCYETGHKLSD